MLLRQLMPDLPPLPFHLTLFFPTALEQEHLRDVSTAYMCLSSLPYYLSYVFSLNMSVILQYFIVRLRLRKRDFLLQSHTSGRKRELYFYQ